MHFSLKFSKMVLFLLSVNLTGSDISVTNEITLTKSVFLCHELDGAGWVSDIFM